MQAERWVLEIHMVEDIEEIYVEPQIYFLADGDKLERGRILEPLPGQWNILVPPRIQVVVVCHALHRAIA